MSNIATAIETFLGLPGLRGFWPFNSFNEIGDAYDLSGHGQTLTANDSPNYYVNALGTPYVDIGSPDYLSINDAANFDILGTESYVASGKKGLTVGGWFYFATFLGIHQCIYKSDFISNCSYELINSTSGSAQMQFGVTGDGSTHKNVTAAALPVGQWHFIVGRYTPSSEVAIFTNKTKATNTTSIPAALFNSTAQFRVSGTCLASMCFLSAEVISDALLDSLYDTTRALFDTGPSVSDTVTLTETVSRTLVSLVKPTETITLTEAQTLSMGRVVSAAETVTLTEAQTLGMTRLTSQAETVTLSETVSRNLLDLVGSSETVTLTETVSRNLLDLVSSSETVTLTETVTADMARPVTASETVTLTEAATANMARLVSQNETVTLTEGQTLALPLTGVSAADTVTLTEAQNARVSTALVSESETVTLTEAQSVVLTGLVSKSETITLSEAGTTVLLVSDVIKSETVTLTEGVTVALSAFRVSVAETITLGEIVLVGTGTNRLINVSELITLTEATGAALFEIVTIVIYDTLAFADVAGAPLVSVTDTLGVNDNVIIAHSVFDTLTLTDDVSIGNVTLVIEDTLTFSEILSLSGPPVVPPASAATSELDYNPVLRLIYGNDRRNPIRTLDLAELAPAAIRLMSGGFAPGAGERTQLWSGESIRFDGQDLLGESRKNSELAISLTLKTGTPGSGKGSEAALSYFQRKVSRFFTEANQHQLLGQNHTVWLEYRWSDGLPDLATPTFGGLSGYYEVFSATAPQWPDSLHNDMQDLTQGLIAGVVLNITGSPAPEGLKQRAATAAGAVSNHAKGVLIASGSSSKLHWAGFTGSGFVGQNYITGLTGLFTITGWITLNAAWGSGNKYVFDYYLSGSNRISIVYDATNNRWTITKIVSGVTFTTNSATDAVSNGDDVHLQLVQDATTLRLYVNGVSAASVTATATMTDFGTIALGCPATGTIDGVDVVLDGWRIMPDTITATQALALYEAELPIKQDGGQVGPPPYFWTTDGDGQLDACDDTTHDHWGIIGGVGGDLEARIEIRLLVPDTASKYYWLGIKAADDTFTPSGYLWSEVITGGSSQIDATASEGSYHRYIGTALTPLGSHTSLDPALVPGKYHWLARLRSSAAATVTPGWFFTNTMPVVNRALSVTNTAFKVLSLGDTFIETEGETVINDASVISLALRLGVAAATSVNFDIDFSFLMPSPFAKITQPDDVSATTPSSTKPLVIEDGHAYVYLAGGSQSDKYEYQGDRLTARPYKYNYLFLMRLDSNGDFLRTNVTNVSVWVTPRYLLPGGMVA